MNVICTFWFDLALITGVLGFRLCSAMFEAVIGTIAQLSLGATLGAGVLVPNSTCKSSSSRGRRLPPSGPLASSFHSSILRWGANICRDGEPCRVGVGLGELR